MKTQITKVSESEITVLNEPIGSLMDGHDITSLILLFNGSAYDTKKADLIRRMMVGFCDYGIVAPSTMCARLAASCGADLTKSLIAALSCFGDSHCPIVKAMSAIAESERTGEINVVGRVPGFGHPIHKVDPRITALSRSAISLFGESKLRFYARAKWMEGAIGVKINYAGVCAALCLDMGIKPEIANMLLILGRIVGLTAHIVEQKQSRKRMICYDENTGQFME